MDPVLREMTEQMLMIPETEGEMQQKAYDKLTDAVAALDHVDSRRMLFESIMHTGRLVRFIARHTGTDSFSILDSVAETPLTGEES